MARSDTGENFQLAASAARAGRFGSLLCLCGNRSNQPQSELAKMRATDVA